jgi:hypothetical protein
MAPVKKQNTIILIAIVVLSGGAIAIWPKQELSRATDKAVEMLRHPAPVGPDAKQGLFVVAPVQTEVTPGAGSPQKKFADMDVLERNAIRREIAKQELPAIFQAMLNAERVEHDPMKQMGLQTTLAGALTEKPASPEFLKQLRAFLTDRSNSYFERQLLIGALESASTKETVDLLINVANSSSEQEIKESAGNVAAVGNLGRGRSELSPALERVWRESKNPNELLSTASSMAKIGTPSGIDLLLSAVLSPDGRDKARLDAAQRALQEIYFPNAVPPLIARLANQSPMSTNAKLVAPILVKIGDAAAGKVVVSWLQNTNENAAPLIEDLIRQRTLGEPMLSIWAAALDPAVPFRSEQNREAIRAGLAAYRADRTLQR